MARLSLSKKKMKRSKLAMAMQWWLYILHLLGLFMELAYRMVERQCMHGVRSRYRLDFYDNRDVIEKWVYKSDSKCMNDFRMPRRPFLKLCHLLSTIGKLKPTRHMLVDEQVAIFLHILAHHIKNRTLQNNFHRSAEAISRSFRKVLVAVMRLQGHLYKTPEPIPQNSTDERWKWFKGCLGALDGIHILVQVPAVDRPKYRNRKGQIATNVLAACTPNLQFTYVLPGWEGSAVDGRVLRDAINRTHGLVVPRGTYYLVDAGYTNGEGFLAPYRGQRYHLNDWKDGRQPTTREEYFNMKHSSARNVIERAFAILKKRWAILRSPSYYPIKIENHIILACCLLHNYIRDELKKDPFENIRFIENRDEEDADIVSSVETSPQWTSFRDNKAASMFYCMESK
ncbi:uncharacterized protein LOC131328489 [Rhododendron vialii]|uniref:uncharacterized protein LOC131328489 n=1 Tax=Rhododendron vialii TaxID=182163 RepID=UPI00265EF1BF|nr:uncharacterized protein LOC131328489 [Rhododendron vialii]